MTKLSVTIFTGLLIASLGAAEQAPVPVSMIQLIVMPEKFDGKLITVTGYLTMEERASLCFHREDAVHGQASNCVAVIRSGEMRRDGEKLNRMYVRIVGVFQAAPAENGGYVKCIKDIKECYTVSDPARPQEIGGKRNPRAKEK